MELIALAVIIVVVGGGVLVCLKLDKIGKPLYSFKHAKELKTALYIHQESFNFIQNKLKNTGSINKMMFKAKVGKDAYEIFANTGQHS